MNEVSTELNALTGGNGAKDTTTVVDWEAKCHELENRLNGAYVEEGRVRKLNDELKARDKRIAELEANRRSEDLASTLSDEERSQIPAEVLDAATKLVSSGMGRIRAENDERFRQMEQRSQEDAEARKAENGRRFLSLVDARFPGFRSSVGPGGDKETHWGKYLRYNRGSIDAALQSGDFDTFAWHVEKFYTDHLGVPVPSGEQDGSAAPDPSTSGGGNSKPDKAVSGKVYTTDEYNALFDMKEAARDRGDWNEVNRITGEINKAPAEGRVKND